MAGNPFKCGKYPSRLVTSIRYWTGAGTGMRHGRHSQRTHHFSADTSEKSHPLCVGMYAALHGNGFALEGARARERVLGGFELSVADVGTVRMFTKLHDPRFVEKRTYRLADRWNTTLNDKIGPNKMQTIWEWTLEMPFGTNVMVLTNYWAVVILSYARPLTCMKIVHKPIGEEIINC